MSLPHSSHWTVPIPRERHAPPGEASALLEALRHAVADDHQPTDDGTHAAFPPLSLEVAYRECTAITRLHSKSFFLSSQFLPPIKRRAIRAFYAFCRTSDDLVDRATDGEADRALARWVHQVHAPEPPHHNPVLLAWKDVAAAYDVKQQLTDELLAGVAMDLTVSRYQTFDDLWLYCYRVASVVGLVSMQIIGYRPGAVPYAISLGVALQLTNILRDVGEDAARGRIYLPQEDLERFGLTDADILAGCCDSRFQRLMHFEIERAHGLYEEAWPGIAMLSEDGQFAIGAAAETYRGILRQIECNEFDVYTRRAQLSLGQKLATLPGMYRRLRTLRRAMCE